MRIQYAHSVCVVKVPHTKGIGLVNGFGKQTGVMHMR